MNFIFLINIIALIFSFFVVGAVLGAFFSEPFRKKLVDTFRRGLLLARSIKNPIIKPGMNPWTAESVMNPAAIILNDRTHLVYRAIGHDGVSRLGYASSADGIIFDKHLPYPVYSARNPEAKSKLPIGMRRYSPVMYPSGGSWGGCEDPRMVVINGRVYVTFNMFEDWRLRVAVISMGTEDFLAERFDKWEGPTVLSHGERDKNWVLFPEKIDGQFAVLHSIIGSDDNCVRVEYIDDLADLSEKKFVSPDPQQVNDKHLAWHIHTRSAGPPPIKTDKGWLVLYHANDAREGYKYKVGAMLLDLSDPTKIIARASSPVLEPNFNYENAGKPGIVYTAGAVVNSGTLFVYYGGADKVVCVATTPLATFLDAIVEGSQASLTSLKTQTA